MEKGNLIDDLERTGPRLLTVLLLAVELRRLKRNLRLLQGTDNLLSKVPDLLPPVLLIMTSTDPHYTNWFVVLRYASMTNLQQRWVASWHKHNL